MSISREFATWRMCTVAVSTVIAGLAVPAGLASASAPSVGQRWIPSIAHFVGSVPNQGIVAAGVVTSGGGTTQPVAGQSVVLYGEPSNDTLASMHNGDALTLTPLSQTMTASDGTFTIGVPRGTDLSPDTSRLADVNFMVVTPGTNAAPIFVGDQTVVGGASNSAARAARAGTAGTLKPTASSDHHLHIVVGSQAPATTVARSSVHPDSGGPPPCTYSQIVDLGNKWVVVGEAFSGAPDTTEQFTYGASQNSDLGVGISTGGAYGTFSGSGTTSVSASATQTFARIDGTAHNAFRTLFDYRKYGVNCGVARVAVEAVSWSGGGNVPLVATPAAGLCVPLLSGQTWTESTTKASTVSAGADLTSAIGISLSSTTGYARTASITYVATHYGRPLCGTNQYPGNAPGMLTVHSSNLGD
jgi:hypothetical protein